MSRLWERRRTPSGHVDIIQDGDIWHRHNVVFPGPGNKQRDRIRAAPGSAPEWAPMGFSFTEAEYEWLQKTRPELFDEKEHPRDRAKKWKAWAETTEGQSFRVR